MEEEREKREQQELKQQQRKTNILQDLKKHNGPCVSVADVDRLPITYCTNGQLKAALRNEILYHKVVVGAKSPLLVVTGNSLDLVNRLRVFLGGEALEQVPNGRNINMRQPARRHPPSDSDMEDADDSKSDSEGDKSQESQEREETTFETAFKFHSVGEVIAVYYLDNFYIGEVVHFDSDEAGTVSFLESARGQVAVYRWPSRPDSCVIPSTVVFARGLVLAPFSSSGRAFVVESPRNLPGRYQAFKKYLVDTCAL